MEKVYCKECEFTRKMCVGYCSCTEYHCFHSTCFTDRDKDTPFSKGRDHKGGYTTKRVSNMDKLNKNNDCQYFREKIGIFKMIAIRYKECFS